MSLPAAEQAEEPVEGGHEVHVADAVAQARPRARRRPSWLLSPLRGRRRSTCRPGAGRRLRILTERDAGLASSPTHWSFNGTLFNRKGGHGRFDTFIAFVGVYARRDDAEADYEAVKDLHTEAGLIDAYDAAVIDAREDGKVKIAKKHETPTRVGGVLGGGVGLATGLVVALFPFAAIGGGLLVGDHGRRRDPRLRGRPRRGGHEPRAT